MDFIQYVPVLCGEMKAICYNTKLISSSTLTSSKYGHTQRIVVVYLVGYIFKKISILDNYIF